MAKESLLLLALVLLFLHFGVSRLFPGDEMGRRLTQIGLPWWLGRLVVLAVCVRAPTYSDLLELFLEINEFMAENNSQIQPYNKYMKSLTILWK